MRFGIALYWVAEDPSHPTPYFHWALALSPEPIWDTSDVRIYQLQGEQSNYQWHFSIASLVEPTLVGVVDLLELTSSEAEQRAYHDLIDSIVRTHTAQEPQDRVLIAGPEEAGVFDMPPEVTWSNIYTSVIERGHILRDLVPHISPYPTLRLVLSESELIARIHQISVILSPTSLSIDESFQYPEVVPH
ncbi:hypothetical protein BDZ89DRAFT_1067176 [Hymenopellis radicata]|nr:hypothetical protein BDZ89DRAFT_1067176 [Hymenopellis radicata]